MAKKALVINKKLHSFTVGDVVTMDVENEPIEFEGGATLTPFLNKYGLRQWLEAEDFEYIDEEETQ